MRKVLITGGAGFIGCNIADDLLSKNEDVTVIDNLVRKGTELNRDWLQSKYKDSFKFLQGDICAYDMLKKAMEGIDIVYHMAAQVAVTTQSLTPKQIFIGMRWELLMCWRPRGK